MILLPIVIFNLQKTITEDLFMDAGIPYTNKKQQTSKHTNVFLNVLGHSDQFQHSLTKPLNSFWYSKYAKMSSILVH